MKNYLMLLLVLFCFSCQKKNEEIRKILNENSLNQKQKPPVLLIKTIIPTIVNKTIILDNISYQTNLFDLKYIGQLKTTNKLPYFIISGRKCVDCDENISIFVWSPTDGIKTLNQNSNRYSYPGKEYDYSNNELIFENQMFYGNCLGYESCIWIQKEKNFNNEWKKSIFILKIKNDAIKEETITDSLEIKNLIKK